MDGLLASCTTSEGSAAILMELRDPTMSKPLSLMLEEIAGIITSFVILPDPSLAMLIALWLANTYTYKHFQYCGYLALRSATPRCGKSKLLRLLRLFAKGNPRVTATPTAAALFRSTREVLLLDEVDRLRNGDKETFGYVLAVLNMGFEAGGAVERTEKVRGNYEVRSYEVYGPKALAGIESLADTLADRSFRIEMKRSLTRMPRLNERKMQEEAFRIREDFQCWAEAHAKQIDEAYEGLPDTISALSEFDDRLQDIAEPLVLLAALADGEGAISDNVHGPRLPQILPRLLAGLQVASGRREMSGRERGLLTLIEIFNDMLGDREEILIASNALVDLCQKSEELSWIETGCSLAGFLKNFDLRPGFNSTKTQRGYTIKQLWVAEWEGRYRGSPGKQP